MDEDCEYDIAVAGPADAGPADAAEVEPAEVEPVAGASASPTPLVATASSSTLFYDIVVGDTVKLRIAWPKFVALRRASDMYLQAVDGLAAAFDRAADTVAMVALGDEAESYRTAAEMAFSCPVGEGGDWGVVVKDDEVFIPPEKKNAFDHLFRAASKAAAVERVLNMYSKIVKYARRIRDGKFRLSREAGVFTAGFDEAGRGVDLKRLPEPEALECLQRLADAGEAMYNAAATPDNDMNDLRAQILPSLAEVRKLVPGCDAAFDILENSYGMVEKNYARYYGDTIATGSQTAMFESLIRDLSTDGDQKLKPKIVAQFNKISRYYAKASNSGRGKADPRYQALVASVTDSQRQIAIGQRASDPDDDLTDAEIAERDAARAEAVAHAAAPSEVAGAGGRLSNDEAAYIAHLLPGGGKKKSPKGSGGTPAPKKKQPKKR
jgi:hypothetical protein